MEVDATKELRRKITLKGSDGSVFVQTIHYYLVPWRCARCEKFGHRDDNFPNRPQTKKVWIPKQAPEKDSSLGEQHTDTTVAQGDLETEKGKDEVVQIVQASSLKGVHQRSQGRPCKWSSVQRGVDATMPIK